MALKGGGKISKQIANNTQAITMKYLIVYKIQTLESYAFENYLALL